MTDLQKKITKFCFPLEQFVVSPRQKYYLGNLAKSLAGHEIAVGHLWSSLWIATFDNVRIQTVLDVQLKNEISAHNQKAQCTQGVKCLINVIEKQKLFFRSHDESVSPINCENYNELLKYTSHPLLEMHFESATVFNGVSNRIQNNLIDTVAS